MTLMSTITSVVTAISARLGFGQPHTTAVQALDPNEIALTQQPLCAPHLGVGQFLEKPGVQKPPRHHEARHARSSAKPKPVASPSNSKGKRQGQRPPSNKPPQAAKANKPTLPAAANRIRAFHDLRKQLGFAHAGTFAGEWHIAGNRFPYTEEVVSKFEAKMRTIQRLHPHLAALSARLEAVGLSGIRYLETGFRLNAGGHTFLYTDADMAAAEQDAENRIHLHTLPARNHQRLTALNTRILALTAGEWLQPMSAVELSETHATYDGTSISLGDETTMNGLFARLELQLAHEEEICRVVTGLQAVQTRSMSAIRRGIALQQQPGTTWIAMNTLTFRSDGFMANQGGRPSGPHAYTTANLERLERDLRQFEADIAKAEAKVAQPLAAARPGTSLRAALSSALHPTT